MILDEDIKGLLNERREYDSSGDPVEGLLFAIIIGKSIVCLAHK
jgi:hypothetical protein